jgi:hypothetical protein
MTPTYSQTIAKIFAYAGYIMIGPASFTLIFPLVLLLEGGAETNFAVLSLLAYGIGFILFIGYHEHQKGNLSKGKIIPLWFATVIFNISLLLAEFAAIFEKHNVSDILWFNQNPGPGEAIFLVLIVWQTAAVWLGTIALKSEMLPTRNIGNVR